MAVQNATCGSTSQDRVRICCNTDKSFFFSFIVVSPSLEDFVLAFPSECVIQNARSESSDKKYCHHTHRNDRSRRKIESQARFAEYLDEMPRFEWILLVPAGHDRRTIWGDNDVQRSPIHAIDYRCRNVHRPLYLSCLGVQCSCNSAGYYVDRFTRDGNSCKFLVRLSYIAPISNLN